MCRVLSDKATEQHFVMLRLVLEFGFSVAFVVDVFSAGIEHTIALLWWLETLPKRGGSAREFWGLLNLNAKGYSGPLHFFFNGDRTVKEKVGGTLTLAA